MLREAVQRLGLPIHSKEISLKEVFDGASEQTGARYSSFKNEHGSRVGTAAELVATRLRKKRHMRPC